MTKIIAVKDNKFIYGSPQKIGDIIGCTGRNLTEHINNGKEILAINGFIVYLKGEILKGKTK
jgi:hypothetical protein